MGLQQLQLSTARALCVLLVVACAGGRPEPAQLRKGWIGVIAGVEMYVTWHAWKMAPWFYITDSDAMMPVRVIISTTGAACVAVTADQWTLARAGEPFYCPEPWRLRAH